MQLGDVLCQEADVSFNVVCVVSIEKRKDTLHILYVFHQGLHDFLQSFDQVLLDSLPQV